MRLNTGESSDSFMARPRESGLFIGHFSRFVMSLRHGRLTDQLTITVRIKIL